MQCQEKKRDGSRCGAHALADEKYCPLHSEPGKAAELGRKGGRRRTVHNPENLKEFPAPKSTAVYAICWHTRLSRYAAAS